MQVCCLLELHENILDGCGLLRNRGLSCRGRCLIALAQHKDRNGVDQSDHDCAGRDGADAVLGRATVVVVHILGCEAAIDRRTGRRSKTRQVTRMRLFTTRHVSATWLRFQNTRTAKA